MDKSRGAYARKNRGGVTRNILTNTDVAARLRAALKEAYGEKKTTAKDVAEDAGQSPRAAENWLAGENPMSLTAFLNAYQNNPSFRAHARKLLLMEREIDPAFEAKLAEFVHIVQQQGRSEAST